MTGSDRDTHLSDTWDSCALAPELGWSRAQQSATATDRATRGCAGHTHSWLPRSRVLRQASCRLRLLQATTRGGSRERRQRNTQPDAKPLATTTTHLDNSSGDGPIRRAAEKDTVSIGSKFSIRGIREIRNELERRRTSHQQTWDRELEPRPNEKKGTISYNPNEKQRTSIARVRDHDARATGHAPSPTPDREGERSGGT